MPECMKQVMRAVEKKTAAVYPHRFEDPSKKRELEKCCRLIDSMIEGLDGTFCGVKIEDETLDIAIKIECDDFQFANDSVFLNAIDKASSITFTSGPSDDLLFITVTLPGVWVIGTAEHGEKSVKQPEDDEREWNDEASLEIVDRFKAYATQAIAVNPLRLKEFIKAYNLAKWAFSKATVSYGLYKPLKTAGYISVTGKRISLGRPNETLIRIKDLADSFGVTPYKDGSVQLLFAFRDIMISIN